MKNLSARTYEAELGYKDAADNVSNPKLKELFKTNAEQRYTFGHEIKDCISKLGGTPQKGGSL